MLEVRNITCLRKLIHFLRLMQWIIKGKLVPPPNLVKQYFIKKFGKIFNIEIFIETGTYHGDMIDAAKKVFKEIYSIELSERLYRIARKRFCRFQHIHILYGDSKEVLPHVLAQVSEPSLFWLDAHYSAGITAKGNTETLFRYS